MSTHKLKLSTWQEQFLSRFDAPLLIAMTGISAGKTRVLAIWIILQSLQKKGLRSIMIAQTYRSLKLVLIKEIEEICQLLNIIYTIHRSDFIITFENGSTIYSFSSENPTAVLGISEIDVLLIDEAAYCNEVIYNYSKDRMRGGKYKPMTRLISSPQNGDVSNYFSELVKNNPDKVIRATAFDNPFTSQDFKDELVERYGEGSNLYRQQILGEIFDIEAVDAIINESDFKDTQRHLASEETLRVGVDMAGQGDDRTVILLRNQNQILKIIELHKADTHTILSHIKQLTNFDKIESIAIDNTGGFGIGIYDLLKITFNRIVLVNFAESAIRNDIYANIRTEMYIDAVKEIRAGFNVNSGEHTLCLKDELKAQRSFINNRGLLALKSKDDVKLRLGRSPDISDALALSFCKKSVELVQDIDINSILANLDTF